jgi:MerR family transcriptional regulator, light-induced transcriptional regulator
MGGGESDLRGELDAALRAHDRPGAVASALRALDDGRVGLLELYGILSQILVDLGAAWQVGAAEVWQEHYVTGVVRTIVEACAPRVDAAAPAVRGDTVVLVAPDDEYHDLGLRMLTDRFTLAGWRAHFLGANVPVNELIAAVRELRADAAVLSASTHFHRVSLHKYAARVAAAHPDLRIWVGGPAFAREHDGWSSDSVLNPLAVPPAGEA